jgi:hypothetical protein
MLTIAVSAGGRRPSAATGVVLSMLGHPRGQLRRLVAMWPAED